MRAAVAVLALSAIGFSLLSGCGGGGDEGPALLIPATGVVNLNGKPLAGAVLTFVPDDATKGTGGYAATDAEGKFAVKHRSGKDGIEPGSYRVTLTRMMKPDGSPIPTGESAMDHGGVETIPAKYTNPESTPIRPTYTDKDVPLTIELTGKTGK